MSPENSYVPKTPQNFYELAWAKRLEFVQSLVDGGEDNGFRIIKMLERHEEKFHLSAESVLGEARDEITGDVVKQMQILTGRAEWLPVLPENNTDYLPTGAPPTTENSFLGSKISVPAYADLKSIVAHWIIEFLHDDDKAIVELGCGYGRNLFNIHYLGGPRDLPYYAAEYTGSGKQLTALLAALESSIQMRVEHFDHNNVDLGFLQGEDQILIFTCHSIEQVKEIPASYFADLARVPKKITCIHFEPFGFQISSDDSISTAQQELFVKNDWNLNFFDVLKAAAEAGSINLTHVYKDMIPNETYSPTSIAIWRNF